MKYLSIIIISTLLFTSCQDRKQGKGTLPVINITTLTDQTASVSLSDLADDVEYIALETNDSVLINKNADVFLFDDLLFVTSTQQGFMVFDRNTGKYIRTIARAGQGPGEYNARGGGNVSYSFDEVTKTIYFKAPQAGEMLRYDLAGNFLGKTVPPFERKQYLGQMPFFYQIIHNSIVMEHKKTPFTPNNISVFSYDTETENLKDSIPSLGKGLAFSNDNIKSISVNGGAYTTDGGVVFKLILKDEKQIHITPNTPSLWRLNDEVRFKEAFIDTIYTVKGSTLTPLMVLNLGEYHWPYEQRFDSHVSESKLFVDYILENDEVIYIHLRKGLYEEKPVEYIALYDKKSGETRVMEDKEGLNDDITNFMPMRIRKVSSTGAFVSLVEAVDVCVRVEELGDELHSSLKHLKKVGEEDNPVIVIAKRKG
jgi:hypothetical protein